MTIRDSIIRETIRSMDSQTKERYIAMVLTEVIDDTPPAERRELLRKFLPQVLTALTQDMSHEERVILLRSTVETVLGTAPVGGSGHQPRRDGEDEA
jgi:hypothetical protein